jgi:hypothetical protein
MPVFSIKPFLSLCVFCITFICLECFSCPFLYLQLQMLGYDISWAGFNIIEVMSSSKFTYKRIGYLSSSQSFHSDTEVSLLLVSVYTYVVT